MNQLRSYSEKLAESLEWLETKTRPLFVFVALFLYFVSIVQLLQTTNPFNDLNPFLVQALTNLSIPFGIILLQEMLDLVSSISKNTLISARNQFEIVVLVVIRSFFKNFAKVNEKVEAGLFAEPVQEAVVKVLVIIVMVALIIFFRHLSKSQHVRRYIDEGRATNLFKQSVVVIFVFLVLTDMLFIGGGFEDLKFITIIFTGLIVIDAIFLLLAILHHIEFDSLAFESGLVISLIFARFPLFASNILAYSLSALGVMFATISLYLLYQSRRLDFVEEIEDSTAD